MVERTGYLERLRQWKDEQVIKVVTGIRRCGKSTLLAQYQDWLRASGVPAEQAIRRVHPALTKTDLFQKEFEAQRQLDKQTKDERKKANLEQAKQDKLRRKAGQ